MTIIDGHAHVFPYLGGACGWESSSAHLTAIERFRLTSAQPDVVQPPELPDTKFRVGKFGRYEWVRDGVECYRQHFSPSLQDMTASPEFILAEMDHTGIDMAVLQNAKTYGKLNEYFAECVKKYPSRFVGLAEINEFEADKEVECLKLRHAVKELGLKGIYYEATRFAEVGRRDAFNDKRFDSFWREIIDLGVPVHWALTFAAWSAQAYMEQMRSFSAWAERFPDIDSVVALGLSARPFKENGEVNFPKELLEIYKKPNVFAEVLYPIQAGALGALGPGWDYPFPQAQRLIKQQYEELGPHKLIWGSDIPNIERNCTYRQSLTYLKDYCNFINPKDMELILGGNIARILKIRTTFRNT